MTRSFEDRMLGGVCGGLGAAFPLNAWIFRLGFVMLTVLNPLVGAALYVAFWWMMPQQTFIHGQRSSFFVTLFMLILALVIVGGWLYSESGGMMTPQGYSLYIPIVVLLLSVVFLIRQLRT